MIQKYALFVHLNLVLCPTLVCIVHVFIFQLPVHLSVLHV